MGEVNAPTHGLVTLFVGGPADGQFFYLRDRYIDIYIPDIEEPSFSAVPDPKDLTSSRMKVHTYRPQTIQDEEGFRYTFFFHWCDGCGYEKASPDVFSPTTLALLVFQFNRYTNVPMDPKLRVHQHQIQPPKGTLYGRLPS